MGLVTKKMIDPPGGWLYGFPKELPEEVQDLDINTWLVENGYPASEIARFTHNVPDAPFPCRMWLEERH